MNYCDYLMGHAISLPDPEQLTREWPKCYRVSQKKKSKTCTGVTFVIPPPSTILRRKLYDFFVYFNQETAATLGRTIPTVAPSVSFSVCDARSGVPQQQMCRVTPLAGGHHKRAPLNKLASSSLGHSQHHCWLNIRLFINLGRSRPLDCLRWDGPG